MNKLWVISVIAVCAGCTFLERAFPFLLFRGKTVPEPVSNTGEGCKRGNRDSLSLEGKHNAFYSRRHGMLHAFNTGCILTSDPAEIQALFRYHFRIVGILRNRYLTETTDGSS